jgi:hypothetical protein
VAVAGDGDGVEVDDAEEELGVGGGCVLHVFPLLQRAEVVAEVGDAGGLDAGEYDLFA